MSSEKGIPVGTVCAMFGLNPNTVRTWERRYQFPSPVRSDSGHRVYGDADLELIGHIVSLIGSGMTPQNAIQQAKNETPQNLEKETLSPPYDTTEIATALNVHDDSLLRIALQKALSHLGYNGFMENLAFPLLGRLGKNWERTGFGIAEEHAFTLAITGIVSERAKSLSPAKEAPVFTLACVPDELHQLPLLHLSNLALEQKIARPLVLTAGLPIDEIIDASRRGGASAILLSATVAPSSSDTRTWVARCINAGWSNRLILAGPGFIRSRVFAEYPVRAGAGSFRQTLGVMRNILSSDTENASVVEK